MSDDRITVEMIGGPHDGTELRITGHRLRWLLPNPAPTGVIAPQDGPVRPEPMLVSVYERIRDTANYEFKGYEKW